MHITGKEIFSQYQALNKTYNLIRDRADSIKSYSQDNHFTNITFTGSGSSYCLCQSAEISAKVHLGLPAQALAAGDLMLNFNHYRKFIGDTLLVAPSRSGSTTEVIHSFKRAREEYNVPAVALTMKEDSDLAEICDLSLEMPWAFDESVCQTRTVTNLYTANLMMIAVMADNNLLLKEVEEAIEKGEDFIEDYHELLKEIGRDSDWDKVIVLADSELQGMGAEAAIAFKEIPRVHSNYHHILDVRHGPMVLVDDSTLVLMVCSPFGFAYQRDLIRDLHEKDAKIVTVGTDRQKELGADFHVKVPEFDNYGVMGIPFIFAPQVIAYYKAVAKDINPDVPEGLDPWIEL